MSAPTQTYATHRRLVPLYHIVLFFMILANFIFSVIHLYLHHTYDAAMNLVMALAWGIMFAYARTFVTTLQDRVIRLEEQLRYERCLPPDLRQRAAGLSMSQIIGLRFASDAELSALVGQALDGKLGQTEIKKQVKEWRADHLRV